MPNSPTTNMSLVLPSQGVDPTGWGSTLNTAMGLVDLHDHSPGKGVQVTPSGLNISSDLSIGSNNLTTVRSLRLNNQVATLSGGSDVRSIYAFAGDLYYNNNSGTPVQLTVGNSLNAAGIATNVYAQQAVAGNITILNTDAFVYLRVDTSSARNITLPAASAVTAGRFYIVKDVTGSSISNVITMIRSGSDTFDGVASNRTLASNFGEWRLVSDGVSNWNVSFALSSSGALTFPSTTTVKFGTTASVSGIFKFPNNAVLLGVRNAANTADITLTVDNLNTMLVGFGATKTALYSSTVAMVQVSNGLVALSQALTVQQTYVNTTYAVDGGANNDYIIMADTTSAGFTVTLPVPAAGRLIIIKDYAGKFGTNNLTLAQHASETIEGIAASRVLSANWGSYTITSDGTNWFIIS